MTIKDITNRLRDVQPIQVADPDHAADEIVPGIIKSGILFYDNRTPVIKMPLYYQRMKSADEEAFIFNMLDDKSQKIVPFKEIKEAAKRLCYIPELQVDLTEEFWKGQMLVNLTHGVYDIIKQELVPLRGEFKFDYVVDICYRPHSKLEDAPNFKNYVETSVGMDQYLCLMRTLGYALSSLTKARKCCVILGRPMVGKSCILDLLESVLKGALVSHESFDRMGTERAKVKYIGRRVNISRETNTKPNKNADSFKSLISNERTTGEEKYEVQKSFIPTLFFIFAGNVDIEFAKECMDDAVIDRLYYIIYDKEIPADKIDLDLDKKLWDERNVIFSIALDSLRGLIEDHYDFKAGPAAVEHLKHKRYLIHTVESFIAERCVISESGKVSSTALYDAYLAFCRANALTPESDRSFYGKVKAYAPSIRRGRAPDINGNLVRGFHGISLIGGESQVTGDDYDE